MSDFLDREMIIRQAVIAQRGKFPINLAGSGVMFFKGERITLEDFTKARRKLSSAGVKFKDRE